MFSKEDYVSLEVAKLLKEKGFDEPCEKEVNIYLGDWAYCDYYDRTCARNSNLPTNKASYPTLYEAKKWLRDKHDIDIVVEPEIDEETDKKWGYCFGFYTEFPCVAVSLVYETYEEALNAGILESLKLLEYEH